jgi:hypothetical protein
LNEDNPNVKRRMATNNPKELEGKSVSNYAVVHDTHFNSEARRDVVEKEEERKTSPENVWLICKVEDMYHERNHWYKLGRTTVQQGTPRLPRNHFNCFTYNVLMETSNDAFDVNVLDDHVTRTEFSKYQALHPTTGWIHFCIFWFQGWCKRFSNLKRVIGIMQSKAEADTWIHGYKGSDPALYSVCGG